MNREQNWSFGKLSSALTLSAILVGAFLPVPASALVRDGDKSAAPRFIPVYTIRNFAGDGKQLGEWYTHREPTVNGSCVSWVQDAGNEKFTVCGGTTHIVRKEEPLMQIQGQGVGIGSPQRR